MAVRRFEKSDKTQVATLLTMFGKEYDSPYKVRRKDVKALFDHVYEIGVGFISLREGRPVGIIGGVLHPNVFNSEVMMLSEYFWYVVPEHRNGRAGAELLLAYEKAGREEADVLCMTLLDTTRGIEDNLIKRGYVMKERTFAKWLP